MVNVCVNCGEYRVDKGGDVEAGIVVCPVCDYAEAFRFLPLFWVAGASGAGKSAVCRALMGREMDVVVLEGDILWLAEFNTPDDGYRGFFETWMRLAKNIAQAGRPVVLFGAGGIPNNVEGCMERRYFSAVHYLALVCDDEVLAKRLQARPTWRKSGGDDFIMEQQKFNRWLQSPEANQVAPITLLDTSVGSVEDTANGVVAWIEGIRSSR